MKKISPFFLLLLLGVTFIFPSLSAQEKSLQPTFSTDRHYQPVLENSFDSKQEINTWSISSSNSSNTWMIGDIKKANLKPFSSVNPKSKASLVIYYDDKVAQDEWIATPEVSSDKPLYCSFYSAFDGGLAIFASFTLYVEDLTTGKKEKLFNSFEYSQATGHERHQWLFFRFKLEDKYLNKAVRFLFQYKGKGGDDVYIDDFKVGSLSHEANDPITILSGEQVTFYDQTEGNVAERSWHFPGGTPEISSEKNPVVTYNKSGEYDVVLTVKESANAQGISTTKSKFVKVTSQLPKALINYPEGGYYSPNAWTYLPANEWIQFCDASLHQPTSWKWQFPNALQVKGATTSCPSVLYDKEGIFDASLIVSNEVGSSRDDLKKAIKVAGHADLWNIEPEVSSTINIIELGWYGFYGGSNFLDMQAFAEKMHAPLKPLTIEGISFYLGKYLPINTEGSFSVAIYSVGKDGLPEKALAEETVQLKDIVFNPNEWNATEVPLRKSLVVEDAFFIVVKDIPTRQSKEGTKFDQIVLGAVRRDANSTRVSHSYHQIKQEDGTIKWFENTDENITLAIAVKGHYPTPEANSTILSKIASQLIYANEHLILPQGYESYLISIIGLDGELKEKLHTVSSQLFMPLPYGSYIINVEAYKGEETCHFVSKVISTQL